VDGDEVKGGGAAPLDDAADDVELDFH
jgi:hypothetical protein